MLDRLRIVLVNTSHPGNIGGAARAMKNMGLSQLVLVDPEDFPSSEATARASGADDILDSVHVVKTLEEALEGCTLAIGTSARERRIPWPLLDSRESGGVALRQLEQGGDVALVFGREYAGLTNDELQRCQYHVHIPTNPDFSSLNLAAAVQVLAYEVRMAWLAHEGLPSKQEKVETTAILNTQLATTDEMERYYQHLEQTLAEIGFLDPRKPRHLMSRLRRLYGRSEVSKLEMNILRGILTETQKVARGEAYKRRDS